MHPWIIIGSISGVVLGLTGAGGAIISVPLFVYWLDMSLVDATAYSLMTVFVAAVLNWWIQRTRAEYALGAVTGVSSFVGAGLAVPLKLVVDDWTIQMMFSTLCLFSLWTLWRKAPTSMEGVIDKPPTASRARVLLKSGISGVFLGGLTTMTGVGGGVVLVPWLAGPMRLPIDRAVATSLLIVIFASAFSVFAQRKILFESASLPEVTGLMLGSLLASLLVRAGLRRIEPVKIQKTRKFVLSGVILFSVLSLLIRSRFG